MSDISLLNIVFLLHLIFDRELYSLIENIVSGLSLFNIVFVGLSISLFM